MKVNQILNESEEITLDGNVLGKVLSLRNVYYHIKKEDRTKTINTKNCSITIKNTSLDLLHHTKDIGITFGIVDGFFELNGHIETLKGCPHTVNGDCTIKNTNITSLKYCPQNIQGDFVLSNNGITTLEGGPVFVGGDYHVTSPDLKNLNGLPKAFSHSNIVLIIPNVTSGLSKLVLAKGINKLRLVMHLQKLCDIVEKYAGEGLKEYFKFEDEMIQAGYESYL